MPPLTSSIRTLGKFVLQIVPPVAGSVISAYLIAVYVKQPAQGGATKPMTAVVYAPSVDAAILLTAADAAARAVRSTHWLLRAEAAQEPESAPARKVVQREAAPAAARPLSPSPLAPVSEKIATLPPPQHYFDAKADEAAAPEQRTRVLGVPVPGLVVAAGERVAGVAERPIGWADATWQFGKRSVGAVTATVGSVLPERMR